MYYRHFSYAMPSTEIGCTAYAMSGTDMRVLCFQEAESPLGRASRLTDSMQDNMREQNVMMVAGISRPPACPARPGLYPQRRSPPRRRPTLACDVAHADPLVWCGTTASTVVLLARLYC
eukprot:1795122-Rhodomonas_salina.1